MDDFKIDKEGSWHYRGMEMTRRDIVAIFYQHLQKSEPGYFVEIGNQRCGVEVEDTAYVVQSISAAGNEGEFQDICLLLSDGSVEALDPDTLRIGEGNVPYCSVKKGCYEARFSRSSYYRLAEFIRHDPQRDEYFITLNGQIHYIRVSRNNTERRLD